MNIFSTVPMSYAIAALGGEIFIDTVDGKVAYDVTTGIKVLVDYDSKATAEISLDGGTTYTPYDRSASPIKLATSLTTIEILIRITAENELYKEVYKFYGELKAPDNDETATLTTTLNGVTYTFTQNVSSKTFSNASNKLPYNTTSALTLDFGVNSATTSIEYGSVVITKTSTNKSINPCYAGTTYNVVIKTQGNPTGSSYTITIE